MKTMEETLHPHDQQEKKMLHTVQQSDDIKDALNNIADNSSKGMSKRMKKSRNYINWVRSVKKDNKGKGTPGHQPSTSSWT